MFSKHEMLPLVYLLSISFVCGVSHKGNKQETNQTHKGTQNNDSQEV